MTASFSLKKLAGAELLYNTLEQGSNLQLFQVCHQPEATEEQPRSCTEKCVYKGNHAGGSVIDKCAWLDSKMGYGLRIPVLEFSISRYRHNQHKATKGLEYAITHHLPPTLREVLRQKTEQFTESAKKATEIARTKAMLKAEKATEIARTKAMLKAEKAKVMASEV